ncbi:CGNR zinc finger domain-containing protein [Actinoplanes awajinensis]|uniref:Zinc finger CGNR domain-containing protein n=1 Tax=Actinoplanes awajinensis subsp. mycoplanecinus TaxID=135947 RepID=A0A101JRL5_9ACTN|nr:CGNR zinc finger domain-containing protein [Actinoplanes awajinensis]KUL31757.1 hypothetical protein ADL15_21520 [Actinoplanes awajinensis subsp. mycoplanecinus]
MEWRLDVDRADEQFLLELLNTTPVADGVDLDELADADAGRAWLRDRGRDASPEEWRAVRAARDDLQAVVRGTADPATLAGWLERLTWQPTLDTDGVHWTWDQPSGRTAAAAAVLAWSALRKSSPGRLRPCGNPECRLFLIDHSKPNSARWCSMAVCGNRMKARRHYGRVRQSAAAEPRH